MKHIRNRISFVGLCTPPRSCLKSRESNFGTTQEKQTPGQIEVRNFQYGNDSAGMRIKKGDRRNLWLRTQIF